MRSKLAKIVFAIFITLLLASVVVPTQAQAQTFKVLHTFHGPNGNGPAGVLIRDSAGNLYGTTEAGGTGKCGTFGCGTAFKLNNNGKQVWLHSFNISDGEEPSAGLLRDATGNLYGTTDYGGNTTCTSGCGTVFKLDGDGKETVLYKFKAPPDGNTPQSLLARDKLGNVYGITQDGGKDSNGTIFKVNKNGKETVLHNFTGGSDGCLPVAGLIADSAGNLYGVTAQGGLGLCDRGYGVVFKLDTANNLTVSPVGRQLDRKRALRVLLLVRLRRRRRALQRPAGSGLGREYLRLDNLWRHLSELQWRHLRRRLQAGLHGQGDRGAQLLRRGRRSGSRGRPDHGRLGQPLWGDLGGRRQQMQSPIWLRNGIPNRPLTPCFSIRGGESSGSHWAVRQSNANFSTPAHSSEGGSAR
jgi:uncharacterized repeat protein (TIGR03803 family)